MSINWVETELKISELQDYKDNPRTISKYDFDRLVESIKEDGYHQRLLVNQDGTIIGGHSRKKALLKAGYKKSDKVKVLMPDKLLEGEDLDRINIKDNLPFGDWDFDMLGNRFERDQLMNWGMSENVLDGLFVPNFEPEEIKNQPKLDTFNEKSVECPKCNHYFVINEK